MSFRAASVFLATCLLALPAFAESTAAPNDDPRVTRFLQQLEADRAALGIPGLSIAIRADGEPLYLGGRGFADVEKQVPADADTAYPVAGLTEAFVAVLAHRLVKQRRLDLDAPVSKWIPAVADDRVRVKHLLSHTSGGVPGILPPPYVAP